eukprot:8365212-Pyramimonas_sp.AAC.1
MGIAGGLDVDRWGNVIAGVEATRWRARQARASPMASIYDCTNTFASKKRNLRVARGGPTPRYRGAALRVDGRGMRMRPVACKDCA